MLFFVFFEAIVIQLDYLWIICQIYLTTWVKGWVTPVSNECDLLSHWFSLLFWKEGCLWWSWRSVGRGFAPNWTMWWISGSDTLMTLSMGSKVTSDCCVRTFCMLVMKLNICFLFQRLLYVYWARWKGVRWAEVCVAAGQTGDTGWVKHVIHCMKGGHQVLK